jgi:hypothetical protein
MWHILRRGRVVYLLLVAKPERKRQFGRPRPGWQDTIKMDLQEDGGVVGTEFR